MASYDRMEWHYDGHFPDNLPKENGGTHIGMFLAWVIEKGLLSQLHRQNSTADVQKVLSRQMTGRDFLDFVCNEKFSDTDLSEEGNAFARHYYMGESTESFKNYMDDYAETLGENVVSIYEIENSWQNYEKLKAVIDKRYEEWNERSHT
jgi:hypothetical protein